MKIKLCGMFREVDIEYANMAKPDYIGFVLNFPKSHRNISPETAIALRAMLDPRILAVGVFVDAELDYIYQCVKQGIIDIIQLHGNEDVEYIQSLRRLVGKVPVIKAIKVNSPQDIIQGENAGADYLLLDGGKGEGRLFDHSIIKKENITLPYFIAGGLTPENLSAASTLGAFAVDLSSGIETDGVKDKYKMIKAVEAARSII